MRLADPKVVRARLEKARANLLDRSLRNRMVNFRGRTKAGEPARRVIEAVGEDPAVVFELLVLQRRTFGFLPRPEDQAAIPADEAELERLAREELGAGPSRPVPVGDTKIQTAESAANLEAKLTKMAREAKSSLEEQGVNVLFLALGMLDWVDGEGEARRAPLILVPVALERTRRGDYRLVHDETDVGGNLSMAAKAKEFGIVLPEVPDAIADVAAYFDEVRASLRGKAGWSVDGSSVVLAFFSYAKYLMYRDLEGDAWPDDAKPWDHDDLGALLHTGYEDPEGTVGEDPFLDPLRPARAMNEITEADGSQLLAILQASTGRSMLIEGPPGTGKSQTIANLVAEAVATGRTVLFVAEKMAALDVVLRRLREAGLGDACLELHSSKASKKAFYAELSRVVGLGRLAVPDATSDQQQLDAERQGLNDYAETMNRPMPGRNLTPRQAFAGWAALPPDPGPEGRLDFAKMAGWTADDFDRRRERVVAMQAFVGRHGPPSANPFAGTTRDLFLPTDRAECDADLAAAEADLASAKRFGAEVAGRLGVGEPACLAECAQMAATVRLLGDGPERGGVTADANWEADAEAIDGLLAQGIRRTHLRQQYAMPHDAWDADVARMRQALADHGGSWFGWLWSDVRAARRNLRTWLGESCPAANPDRVAVLDGIREEQGLRRAIDEQRKLGSARFGDLWQGADSDWRRIEGVVRWVREVRSAEQSGAALPGTIRLADRRPVLVPPSDDAPRLTELAKAALTTLQAALARLGLPSAHRVCLERFEAQEAWLARARQELGRVSEAIEWARTAKEAQALGMGQVSALAEAWPEAAVRLVERFDRCWYEGLLNEAVRNSPALARFARLGHEETIAAFAERDTRLQQINRVRIAARHLAGVPRQGIAGNVQWLWRQFELSKMQAPIRKAMAQAAGAIQAIKPVFLMSPMSVAMYLPPGTAFDMVVFDEASQVKPEDALGAIARGRHTVVVGDIKQMPPTSFFDKLTAEPVDDDELADEEGIADLESLHGVMNVAVAPGSPRRRRLRWHYRSRHDSLIETSNRLFYDDSLVVFPSPQRRGDGMGVRWVPVPGVYGRGNARTNPVEADAVVEAALHHVRTRPDLTVGIAAFSQPQQEAIQDRLDRLRLDHPEIDAFEDAHPFEPIFVKNLENVQGDERDVVLISVGYGRDEAGKVSRNFGPLNQAGGERRLNVLITRARVRCEVYTNLVPEDLAEVDGEPEGLRCLRAFLRFAQARGQAEVESGAPADGLVAKVAEGLERRGWHAHTGLGHGAYTIDLAVAHPSEPGRYVLAVEFDGAKYGAARSCRDRDKLRDRVLRDRGWAIHRVWARDWWDGPERELDRIVAAAEAALKGAETPEPPAPGGLTVPTVEAAVLVPSPSAAYVPAKLDATAASLAFADANPVQLSRLLAQVVEAEGPVHIEEAFRRIREAAGAARLGPRAKAALEEAVGIAGRDGRIGVDGEFLVGPGEPKIVARDRSGLAASSRQARYVHPAETAAILLETVGQSFGIRREEAIRVAMERLGFGSVRDAAVAHGESVVARLLAEGRLVERGGELRLPD